MRFRRCAWAYVFLTVGGCSLKSTADPPPPEDEDSADEGEGGMGGGAAGGAAMGGDGGGGGRGGGGASGADAALPREDARDAAPSIARDSAPLPDAPVQIACTGLPRLRLERVARANGPVLAVAPPDDPRLFIVERGGNVRFLRNGNLIPFLTMANRPSSNGERGLLGLAFHPNYAANGRFFIFYTRGNVDASAPGVEGDLVIAEGRRSANDPDRAEPTTRPLFVVTHPPTPYANHNGGMVAFGPEGLLYVGIGDGFSARQSAQQATNRIGKILRVDVDAVDLRPAGNRPAPADNLVWALGLRNPWRFSFDRLTGDLYVGDVGDGSWEEISVIPRGSVGPNLGWPTMEGLHCRGCNMSDFLLPVAEYPRGGSGRAVIGGFVYRGRALPCLAGRYLYGDHESNQIFSFVLRNGRATDPVELTADLSSPDTRIQGLSGFGEDAAGELYLVDLFGNVYRIAPE